MGVAVEDVVLGQMRLPELGGFIVTADADDVIALKDCRIEQLRVNLEHIDQQVPGPIDSLVLEIITK